MIEADLGGVVAIESENPSPWSADLLARELKIQEAIQFVAEGADAQILGWCACRIVRPEAELLKIAVKEKNRESGIGLSLCRHLFGELEKRHVTSLFLEVRSNNHTALKFYKKHGFLQVGIRPGYYSAPPDSAIILKKIF